MAFRASKDEIKDVRELFDEVDYALKKFKMKTGANNQYIAMLLGALMNDYRVNTSDVSSFKQGPTRPRRMS